MIWWHIVLVALCSYLIGNISIARIISKRKHADVTKLGSGNPGSTNMLRNFGFKIGFLNFLLDVLKGVVPTLITYIIFGSKVMLYIAGVSAILGHIYPVFFKFKGGKGIASMLGVFLVANPIVTVIVILIAACSWLCFEYGSVASFLCVTALTVIEGINAKNLPMPDQNIVCILLFAIFCFTWWAHRGNINRLLVGKESKVSLIKSTKKKLKISKKED
ncbi:MAG: glycerol-3-phosphate 1-O-acyltransferase PlsY [Clostridia bacterium]|nr:glycerol-3-phosphate 1-O-acyltransferase PlsY [Clostridia bacterium]